MMYEEFNGLPKKGKYDTKKNLCILQLILYNEIMIIFYYY